MVLGQLEEKKGINNHGAGGYLEGFLTDFIHSFIHLLNKHFTPSLCQMLHHILQ